jgi:hypothetical protein
MDRPEGGEIMLTLVDYLPRYREAEEERKRLEERGRTVAMGVTNLALGIGGVDLGSGGGAA